MRARRWSAPDEVRRKTRECPRERAGRAQRGSWSSPATDQEARKEHVQRDHGQATDEHEAQEHGPARLPHPQPGCHRKEQEPGEHLDNDVLVTQPGPGCVEAALTGHDGVSECRPRMAKMTKAATPTKLST